MIFFISPNPKLISTWWGPRYSRLIRATILPPCAAAGGSKIDLEFFREPEEMYGKDMAKMLKWWSADVARVVFPSWVPFPRVVFRVQCWFSGVYDIFIAANCGWFVCKFRELPKSEMGKGKLPNRLGSFIYPCQKRIPDCILWFPLR